jgi:hypothetical protein
VPFLRDLKKDKISLKAREKKIMIIMKMRIKENQLKLNIRNQKILVKKIKRNYKMKPTMY